MPVNDNISFNPAPPPPHDILHDIDPDENFLNNIFPSLDNINQSEYYTIERYNSKFSNSTDLTAFHCNVRSYRANVDYFDTLFNSLYKTPEIIIYTETWLSNESKMFASYEGYKSFHTVRNGRGGGVSIFVDEQYRVMEICELSVCNETIESCVVEVQCDGDKFVLFGIYRPPS
jgi:hypothetical protein